MKPEPIALIIDNERAARRLLRALLEPQGYRVFEAETAQCGLDQAVERKPDVIILEMTLSNGGGLDVLQGLREWNHTPVLVLSQEADDEVKVAALDAGASDYLTKPFSGVELLARLRVLLRPLPNTPDGPLLIEGDLVANLTTHEISVKGRPVSLSAKEETLFYVLAHYAGKVVTRSHLLRSIWGIHSEEKNHDLQVLMALLRKKLEPLGGELFIRTERNVGYSLVLSAPSKPAPASNRELVPLPGQPTASE